MTAIVASEIVLRYSAPAGTAGKSTAQASPNASLGKYMSSTPWPGGSANDLFDDISGAENAASTVDYRCIFVENTNTANALANAVAYLSAEVAGGASIAIGVDTTAASSATSGTQQALTVASETTAPAGVAFSSPTTAAAGVALGSIPAGQCRAIWIRRTAANSAALSADGVTVAIAGDTGSL